MPLHQKMNALDPDAELTADAILARMGNSYAGCHTYQDHGSVRTSEIPGKQHSAETQAFSTVFERSGCFRFEYGPDKDNYVVWMRGRHVRFYGAASERMSVLIRIGLFLLSVPGRLYTSLFAREQMLALALAGATGVSGGSAHHVPALLMPELKMRWPLTRLQNAERLEDGLLEDTRCFCVRGKYAGDAMLLWIEQATFLVRRIEQHFNSGWTTTTDYRPLIGPIIEPQRFAFRPNMAAVPRA